MGNGWPCLHATRSSLKIARPFTRRCEAGINPRVLQKNFRNFLLKQEITSNALVDLLALRFPSSASALLGLRLYSFKHASGRQIRPAAHRDHHGWEWSLGQGARFAANQGPRGR